ncbi:hypothetical protein [Novosphingobium kaempferiae]|uniref:hypothetical protein n=1 Tax=Novosphingobium kaempferiae TaxID=2896849 RepID=UPI001E38FB97|nr:hypothetical protein [Novosphingobium kaempferiae]
MTAGGEIAQAFTNLNDSFDSRGVSDIDRGAGIEKPAPKPRRGPIVHPAKSGFFRQTFEMLPDGVKYLTARAN